MAAISKSGSSGHGALNYGPFTAKPPFTAPRIRQSRTGSGGYAGRLYAAGFVDKPPFTPDDTNLFNYTIYARKRGRR